MARADRRAATTPSRNAPAHSGRTASTRERQAETIASPPAARASSGTEARQSPSVPALASIHASHQPPTRRDSSWARSSSETCSSSMSSSASGSRANTPEPLARSMERLPPCAPLEWWWQ